MQEVTRLQLYLLRAMYLLMVVGLGLTAWPDIIAPDHRAADSHAVVQAFLGAFSLLALLGLRYPLALIPILLFELIWKSLWVAVYAIPVWLTNGLDDYASGVLFACVLGIVLTPIAIPWKYVVSRYVMAVGETWRNQNQIQFTSIKVPETGSK
ncbi:MAG TPA: hypothetical protein VL995_16815 [Cellvibrio sp.]|nr:hypothetical protein [Cellvibrio sp.]